MQITVSSQGGDFCFSQNRKNQGSRAMGCHPVASSLSKVGLQEEGSEAVITHQSARLLFLLSSPICNPHLLLVGKDCCCGSLAPMSKLLGVLVGQLWAASLRPTDRGRNDWMPLCLGNTRIQLTYPTLLQALSNLKTSPRYLYIYAQKLWLVCHIRAINSLKPS